MRFVSLVLVLAACGGGGGSSASSLPPVDLSGTWTGTVRSFVVAETYNATLTLQSVGGGVYTVNGGIPSSPCFANVSGSTTTPSGGQFTFRSDGLSVTLAPDAAGQTLEGPYRVEGSSPCAGDRGAVRLTRQADSAFLYVEQIDFPDLTVRIEVRGEDR